MGWGWESAVFASMGSCVKDTQFLEYDIDDYGWDALKSCVQQNWDGSVFAYMASYVQQYWGDDESELFSMISCVQEGLFGHATVSSSCHEEWIDWNHVIDRLESCINYSNILVPMQNAYVSFSKRFSSVATNPKCTYARIVLCTHAFRFGLTQ